MDASIDTKALWDLSYGLYIVTSAWDGRFNGQIANAAFQVSATPPRVAVSINKLNLTHEYIGRSGVLALSTLEEQTPMERIGLFGFKSGREVDKFAQTAYLLGSTGCPIVTDSALSAMEGRVVGSADGGTHTVFLVELTRADVLKAGSPLTYAYYQNVKRGRASKNAPTYKGDAVPVEEAASGRFECGTCGYQYDPRKGDPGAHVPPGTRFEDLPPDWTCPVCGAAREGFALVA